MKITPATFGDELPGWVLRGTLCSLSSFYWAALAGFQQPAEILGMLTGVALWVAIFAGVSLRVGRGGGTGGRVVPALKRAAWIKFALTVGGWVLYVGISHWSSRGADKFVSVGMLDVAMGVAALGIVGAVGGFHGPEQIATLDSFGWTTLTTVVDGALFALVIGLISLLVLGWWRLTRGSDSKSEFVPVRT